MSGTIVLELPSPPSVNNAYFVARGRKVLSKEGRDYKARVATLCERARLTMIQGPVVLSIHWRRSRRAGDLSNRCKLVEDALKGYAWSDDSQVVALHMYRTDDPDNAGVTVTVERAA